MSDFEDRLGRALGAGADDAPGAVGLAGAARVRARRRRTRRVVAGAVVAVVAVAVPVAVVMSGSGPGGRGADDTAVAADDLLRQEVTCGGGEAWPAAAMDGGLAGVVDDAEVRAAFADVLEEAPMDAPTAIREDGAERASYVVLAGGGDTVTLGVGAWGVAGPDDGAMVAELERQVDGSWRMTGWGDCRLTVALPAGRSLVEVSAPRGGVDPAATEPEVLVGEVECTSGRDPLPFLGEPQVVEDDTQVLVTLTSEEVVGGAECQGNPQVPLTLSLDAPIGDRALLDAGTFPPTPIEVAPPATGDSGDSAEWRSVTHEGDPVNESGDGTVLLDLPPGWEQLDMSGCDFEFDFPRFGPPEEDPCGEAPSVRLYGSATFDACCPPGLEDGATEGYVYVGSLVAYVIAADHESARRILASARQPGDDAPSAEWRTDDLGTAVVDVPDDDSVDVRAVLARTTTDEVVDRQARWTGSGAWEARIGVGPGTWVRVTAPTQALADLVASTVRPD